MSFQKCPICNGTGVLNSQYSVNSVCSTCNGAKIISELTGLPPHGVSTIIKNAPTNFNQGTCHNKNCFCDGSCLNIPSSTVKYNEKG